MKNLALLANVTTGCNSIVIQNLVTKSKLLRTINVKELANNDYIVYVNGIIQGITNAPREFYQELDQFRIERYFSSQVSYSLCDIDKEIRIFCDAGRYIRPVLILNSSTNQLMLTEHHMSMSFSEMVENNLIRYIDSNEAEKSVIAMTIKDLETKKCDYAEIHPSLMLGVCSAVIPYSEHNQCPRLIYQASMVKQALGVYSLAYKHRFDTTSHVLSYPQKPLAKTRYDKILKYDEMMTGMNPIVAIAAYGGANQEDSIIMNKSSVDRGLFVHTCFKTIGTEEKKKSDNIFECIKVPTKASQVNGYNYSKIQSNGIIKKGTPVIKGDVIVGKVSLKAQKEEDCSLIVALAEEGIVDEIWEGLNEEGNKSVKIRIRQTRIPETGDKCASRSSQKGVIGALLTQENMPFTLQGITPDLIINPLCMPSRMTLSQLLESLSSKVSALSGNFTDATTFTSESIEPLEKISNQLKQYGFSKYGKERMYNGYTGEMLEAEIYIGPTYYQRLKHLVKDKIHCVTLDHDVLTLTGWKNIKDLTINDKIGTLNPKTNKLEYQFPLNVFDYPDYQGLMYEIKTNKTDLCVTGNHRMWVQKSGNFGFIEAQYLYKKKVFYQHNCNGLNEEDFKLECLVSIFKHLNKPYFELLFTLLDLFAIYWHYGKFIQGCICFEYYQNEKLKKKISNCLTFFNCAFILSKDNIIVSNDQKLLEVAKQTDFFNNILPNWLFSLASFEIHLFLQTLFIDKKLFITGPFASQKADAIQQLSLHAAQVSLINQTQHGYILSMDDDTNESYEEVFKEKLENRKCHVKCVQVPNEIFYIRRNGKPTWTGNSRARGNITMMFNQPADGRSVDGGLRTGEMGIFNLSFFLFIFF